MPLEVPNFWLKMGGRDGTVLVTIYSGTLCKKEMSRSEALSSRNYLIEYWLSEFYLGDHRNS